MICGMINPNVPFDEDRVLASGSCLVILTQLAESTDSSLDPFLRRLKDANPTMSAPVPALSRRIT